VDVGMAIPALRRLDFVEGIQTLGEVALFARNHAVLSPQRVGRRRMLGYCEGGGLEALNRVARAAVAAILARIELPMMRIVLMAIQAFLESNRPVEIPSQVTQFATHSRVLAQQGVLRGGMIKALTYRGRGDLFPTRRRMARLARGLENTVVWIAVAITASVKGQAYVLDNFGIAGFRLVALLARHPAVLTRQGVVRARMIKPSGGLPTVEIVTTHAVATQLTLMPVDMAGDAVTGEAQKCAIQVSDLYGGTLSGRNMSGSVALLAVHPSVFPLQNVARLVMVECFLRRLPMNQLEVLAIMFRVTANTIFATGSFVSN
jgi:hypothetical protein